MQPVAKHSTADLADLGAAVLAETDFPDVAGLSRNAVRRIVRLRAAEIRYMRDGLEAARIFAGAGRPKAVDRFIGQCLTASRRARRLARRMEERAA